MNEQTYIGINNEFLKLQELRKGDSISFDKDILSPLLFVWVRGKNSNIIHDSVKVKVENNTILCVSRFDKIKFDNLDNARIIKFNREFYCVLDHDKEVSCKGILFYGTNQLPNFQIPQEELDKFETLWKMFEIEMQSKDELQLEMLQTMLKRFIILCTRMFKSQNQLLQLDNMEIDIVREFNFLVEQNFKTIHSVQDYASLLNKSPKTLSNLFSIVSKKTPLQIIHERKCIEAKRLLRYTDKSIKEIGYEIGFEDIQTFSKFFKKMENTSPSDFKNTTLGTLTNSLGTTA
jgi:AraC-like DNA-binding protein